MSARDGCSLIRDFDLIEPSGQVLRFGRPERIARRPRASFQAADWAGQMAAMAVGLLAGTVSAFV